MKIETSGKVISVKKQIWFKVNTKAFRTGPSDGAVFPNIIKVVFKADGKEYTKRKWIGAGLPVPPEGSSVKVIYEESRPSGAKIVYEPYSGIRFETK